MDALICGGGMITHDQLLPALFQLQRLGVMGQVTVNARHEATLQALESSDILRAAFPGQRAQQRVCSFEVAIREMGPRNLVVMALPDQLHFDAIMAALEADQHVIAVKPLVLKLEHAHTIEKTARERGLFVGIEYHKRFDDRSLIARRRYQAGQFGEFKLGTARLMEKWYYRHSNFQNWFTSENSDAFTYIGCHYIDLVHFITGLLPHSVSVFGIKDRFPNGNEGYLWTDARVVWNNGACLNVQNSLCFPDAGPGSNTQGITLYCAGPETGGMISHSDQYRGLEYVYIDEPKSPGATTYSEPSPDYLQYVPYPGEGLMAVGYGYRSVEALVRTCLQVQSAADPQKILDDIDRAGLIATPANSSFNEVVIEAARQSLAEGGREVVCKYE